ncbi:MAG: hypothetical protein ACOY0S_00150, partial [Patescibacteria group bacterium]
MRSFLLILLIVFVMFWQTWVRGLYPYPGNFMLAWWEPWKTENVRGGTITIAHKPIIDDAFRLLLPLRILAVDLIKSGQWPLINPYNGAGSPLLAVMHPGFLNPFGIFFFFLPVHWAWTLFIAFQPLLLGFGFYLYCRKIGQSVAAALIATIILLFSGYVTVRLEYGEFLYGLATLPLLLYLIEDWAQNPASRRILFVPPTVLFLLLAGQPHMSVYVLGVVGVYALWRFWTRDFRKLFWRLELLLALVILGIGLAAVQLVPSFELYFNSTIISGGSSRFILEKFLLPLSHLVTVAIPNYFGNHATYNYFGAGGDSIETTAYLGLIPLFFATLAFLNLKARKHVLFFAILALITAASAINWPGARLLFRLPIPIISAEAPSRIFVLTTFALAVLSGFGFNAWSAALKFSRSLKRYFGGFILVVGLILTVTFALYWIRAACPSVYILNCRLISLRNVLLETGVFTIFSIAFLTAFAGRFWRQGAILLNGTLILALGLYNSYKFLPFSPKSTFVPPNKLFTALSQYTHDGRVFGLGGANFLPNFATAYRVYDPNYYEPLHVRRYAELVHYANRGTAEGKLERSDVLILPGIKVDAATASRRQRLLDLLSVKYLLYKPGEAPQALIPLWQDPSWILVKNETARPRAYLVSRYEVIPQNTQLLSRLFAPDFDPGGSVILEEDPKLTLKRTALEPGQANVATFREQEVEIKTQSGETAILVVTDTDYPGWKA